MRRLIVESEATRQVDAHLPRVRVLLADFPRAMRLLPMVGLVERVAEGEPAFDALRERYRVHLGPFGVGGFSGTLRLVLDVERQASSERYALVMTTVAGEGNTDASIDFVACQRAQGSEVRCRVWAAPRKEIPAMLPLSLVRRAASRVLEGTIDTGLEGLSGAVEADASHP